MNVLVHGRLKVGETGPQGPLGVTCPLGRLRSHWSTLAAAGAPYTGLRQVRSGHGTTSPQLDLAHSTNTFLACVSPPTKSTRRAVVSGRDR
jgi:hypothetical protein